MSKFTAGSAVKYVFLPGVLPRFKTLFLNGFSLLAYYVAVVYAMAGLIPRAHPYLNQENIGTFGVRQAIFTAFRNLEFRWKNIDRILFFFAVVTGLFLTLLYLVGFVFYILIGTSSAAVDLTTLFANPYPQEDIAFMMMDKMLGIPGIYNSNVGYDPARFGPFPSPFHYALQTLFSYYSYGMLAAAVLIFIYFIVEIVLETANTGTPFGKHFENPFVPLRLIAAIGLLIPLSYGMNSAQYITLYVAKMGSNFATNAWIDFIGTMNNPMGMDNKELMALPISPDYAGLAKDVFVIRACKDVDQRLASRLDPSDDPAPSTNPDEIVVVGAKAKTFIDAFFVDGDRSFNVLGRGTQPGKKWPAGYGANYLNLYLEGLRFYKGKNVKIVFGRYDKEHINENKNKFPGGIEPVCGEITIPNFLPEGQPIPAGDVSPAEVNEGMLIGASHMYAILKMIYDVTKDGWADTLSDTTDEYYNYRLMRMATDRYFYLDTSIGQKEVTKLQYEYGDPQKKYYCPNDSDDDDIDDDGDLKFERLGVCNGPIENKFFVMLIEEYQRYFSYGPVMGYDYFTGLGQQKLNERYSAINCGKNVSGAADTCNRLRDFAQKTRDGYQDYLPYPSVYFEDLGQTNEFNIDKNRATGLLRYGWGGAGIWYKLLAEKNGKLMGSTNELPRVTHLPMIMENIAGEKGATDNATSSSGCERYNPSVAGTAPISQAGNERGAKDLAEMYYGICKNLNLNEHMRMVATNTVKSGNPLVDMINSLFGMKTLFSFRENSEVHPMAQLAALGRALIDKAVFTIATSTGSSAFGGLLSLFGLSTGGATGDFITAIGEGTMALAHMMVSFATTGLVAGILLYYVLPFMPFMYFFFAVGTWVKTVFEALVGMPLWALAHLRLDGGPGFAGKAASGGYYMLLEIFIRPILTIFALVASMLIFMALANMLNVTWGIVTDNLVGFDPNTQLSANELDVAHLRPRLDQFFYTIIYIIFMYMTATGCFKLIDQIPDGIMRWLSDVRTWGPNDSADEMVGDVGQTVGVPAFYYTTQVTTGVVDLAGNVPKNVGGTVAAIKGMGEKMATPPKGGN